MRLFLALLVVSSVLFAGVLKEDNLPGIDVEKNGGNARIITSPDSRSVVPEIATTRYSSRAEILWADRAHLNAIAQHTSLAGNGSWIQSGWWLNNERTSLYRTLGSGAPAWAYNLPATEWYIPVDVSYTGADIGAGAGGEPFYGFTSSSPAPQWSYSLPDGFKIATSAQGTTVSVSDDGSVYGVLGSGGGMGRLFVLDNTGALIRTIDFLPNSGIYGLDIANDGSVLCVSTYYAIYIYNLDGSRRDSLYNYGQTVAAISGSGDYVVVGAFNQRVYLYRWNGSDYDQVWQHLTGHPWVTAVAISDDGSTIMAGTYQYSPANTGKVLLYDSSSATPLWEYAQYGDYVAACALTSDGARAVAGSWGQYGGTFGDVITVFDRTSATPIFQILDDIEEPGSIFSVDIAKDGSFVCAGGKAVHAREMGNGGEVYAIRMLDALATDVGVMAINAPGPFLQTGQSIAPQSVIKNFGTAAASFNTVCTILDSLGGELFVDTVAVSNLASGDEVTLTFTPNWTVPAYGTYSTVVYTALAGDLFPANDTLSQGSICYHDGSLMSIAYPFSELTMNYSRPPRAMIMNKGSYSENIPVTCEIRNSGGTIVYTGTGQYYLSPLQSATLNLSPNWIPSDTGLFTDYFFTTVTDDYVPGNDSLDRSTNITTEIFRDDGALDIYGYVSTTYADNKFGQKMIPCLSPPYYISRARVYVSGADPIIMSLNTDSLGLPGLGPAYYISPAETLYPAGTGWVVKDFVPTIQMSTSNPFWFLVHWLSTSPDAPYIGMDNTIPRDSLSYWYWTDPGDPGWHAWTSYDFMMRVFTEAQVGISAYENDEPMRFAVNAPLPNPFVTRTTFGITIPRNGLLNVRVYDINGRLVEKIHDGRVDTGVYKIQWGRSNDADFSAGIYFLKVEFEGETVTKKIILL